MLKMVVNEHLKLCFDFVTDYAVMVIQKVVVH